jgi:hypothetical protein
MPLPIGTGSSTPMVASLKELFEALSAAAPKQQYCLDCGLHLAHMNAHF